MAGKAGQIIPTGERICLVAYLCGGIRNRGNIAIAVLGTHGRRAFKKLIMGSITEEVFRMASCPVLMVGPKAAPLKKR